MEVSNFGAVYLVRLHAPVSPNVLDVVQIKNVGFGDIAVKSELDKTREKRCRLS